MVAHHIFGKLHLLYRQLNRIAVIRRVKRHTILHFAHADRARGGNMLLIGGGQGAGRVELFGSAGKVKITRFEIGGCRIGDIGSQYIIAARAQPNTDA